jgi:hypothetical protein
MYLSQFSTASVSLQELLGLRERRLGALARPDQAPPASAPARGFLYLLAGCDCAFEAVRYACWPLFDACPVHLGSKDLALLSCTS